MDPDAADRRKDRSWRQLTEKKPGQRPGFFDGLALETRKAATATVDHAGFMAAKVVS